MGPRVKSQAVLGHIQICERRKLGKTEINSEQTRKVEIRELVTMRGRDEVRVSIPNTTPLSNSSLHETHPYFLFFFATASQ